MHLFILILIRVHKQQVSPTATFPQSFLHSFQSKMASILQGLQELKKHFATEADFLKSMASRASRLDLDTNKHYCKVQGGKIEYVGKFVRAYRMGSGDGMTAHWEFTKDGKVTRIDDEMWGSLGGAELAGFVAVDNPSSS